ncbi:MAG: hypothetical protein WAL64_10945 [Candidatus Dormiibacterota bacterium]
MAEQQLERSLAKAWHALTDAAMIAEAQSRYLHKRRLERAASMIVECQTDIVATREVTQRAGERSFNRFVTGQYTGVND